MSRLVYNFFESVLWGKFAILELSVVVWSFLYQRLNFALKSPSSITKNGFVSKILSRTSSKFFANVSNSSWNWLGDLYQDTISQNLLPSFNSKTIHSCKRKYPVFLVVMNFYNRHTRLLFCYWKGGLPKLGHILVSPSCYHQIVYLNRDMLLTKK